MEHTFYADESGKSGVKRIRSATSSGASPYMTLGGVLVPNKHKAAIRERLAQLADEFGKPNLHCSKLKHEQIVRFAQVVCEQQVLLFGVISLKETLGEYREEIGASDKFYYDKCAQYLLERLAHFLEEESIGEGSISICFEDGSFEYAKLRGLIAKCCKNPIHPATRRLKGRINPMSIAALPKEKEPLLQLADIVAHALYRCVDDGPTTFGVKEPRYTFELAKRFFSSRSTGLIVGHGIYAVHKLHEIRATPEINQFLRELKKS